MSEDYITCVCGDQSRAAYLIKGKKNVLFDAGMAYSADKMIENIKRELGDRPLEHQRVLRVSGQRRGAGAVDTVFVDDGLGHFLDLGVRGQAQIVLGGEIDPLETHAGVVLCRADGQGRLLR